MIRYCDLASKRVSPNCQIGKSADRLTFREQPVGRFVQMPLGAGIWQMSNQLSGKLVNVAAFEVVELLSLGIEDSRTNDDRYKGATTIEYIAIHDRPPVEVPHYGKGCAYWVTIARRI